MPTHALRARLTQALCLSALWCCGRTELVEPTRPDAAVLQPDASIVETLDAGSEAPFAVFLEGAPCPSLGTEADMARRISGDELHVTRVRVLEECSGAGGDWLVARAVGSSRDFMLGNHACWFVQPRSLAGTEAFGVVRHTVFMAGRSGPEGWCITTPEGSEPVSSFSTVRAIALFRTEAGARAAVTRWR